MGAMGKKGDDTRTRILDAAQQLILSYGYSGMSLDQLIRQLGMTKGAFFHHFKNKHDLARTLIQRYSDEGVTLFKTALARARETGGRLGDTLVSLGLLKHHDLFRVVELQFRTRFIQLFQWPTGWYEFLEGRTPSGEIIPLNDHTVQLIK